MNALRLGMLFWLALSITAEAKTWTVNPGQSIQESIDKAEPGDTVQALPGEYPESLRIDKENLRVVGMTYEGRRTELLGEDEREMGILVTTTGVTVEGFLLRGFINTGIRVRHTSDVKLQGMNIYGAANGAIELNNVQRITVENCVARNNNMGISVRYGQEIRIAGCEMSRNIFGASLHFVIQGIIENNSIFGNNYGVTLMSLDEPDERSQYCKIIHNRISNNDFERFTMDDEADANPNIPFGIGIAVIRCDHTEIARNFIEDNAWFGIVVAGGEKFEEAAEELADSSSNHTYVHHNEYRNNGFFVPKDEKMKKEWPRVDIYFDGKGERNQFQESQEIKTFPENLVVKHGGVHTEVIHFL